jgi:DNA-binding transcriptional ArsR family regulator
LAEANLVRHTGEVVQRTQHPALQDPKIETIVETDTEDWDAVLACLADRRRRVVLSTLSMNDAPMDRLELATRLAETVNGDTDPNGSVKPVLQELHHTHLPKLESAGLLTYDVEAKTVTYEGHPSLDEEWLIAGESDSPRSILATGSTADDIWTNEGRDDVAERGRALVASAEEELL